MRSCLAEALRSVRLPDSPAGLEAVRALERDLEGYLRVESALDMPLAPARLRGAVRHRPARPRV